MSKGWIGWTIFGSVVVIMFFGMFWAMYLADARLTFEIAMDERTKEWLDENDYCVYSQINKTRATNFFGDCEYLEKGIVSVSEGGER